MASAGRFPQPPGEYDRKCRCEESEDQRGEARPVLHPIGGVSASIPVALAEGHSRRHAVVKYHGSLTEPRHSTLFTPTRVQQRLPFSGVEQVARLRKSIALVRKICAGEI